LSLNSFDELNAAFQDAQAKWLQGDLLSAYDLLLAVLTDRLLSTQLINADLRDADLKVIQSLADLAGILGEFKAAESLLTGAIALYEAANSRRSADYTRMRQIQLLIDQGKLSQAKAVLQAMQPRIGTIQSIQFSPAGLLQWEAGCAWLGSDLQERTVLFAELYLAMGRLLSALGQYGDALAALQRGLFHAEEQTSPALAQQTILPLKLAIAAAHLEKGDLILAEEKLAVLGKLDPSDPIPYVYRLELIGKLSLLKGDFGKALEQFRQVQAVCRQFQAQRAVLRSTLNLAQIMILLNQTSAAQSYLVEVQADAIALEDAALISRAALLLQLADARGRSLVVGSPAGLSVTHLRAIEPPSPIALAEQESLFSSTPSSNYLAWFEDRALAFQWQLSCFNFTAAARWLNHIQQTFQYTDSRLIQVQLRVLEAMLSYYEGTEYEYAKSPLRTFRLDKIQQANALLEAVCPTLKALGLKPQLWQAQRLLGWCRSRLHNQQESLTEETNLLLAELTESLSPEDQVIYLLNKWSADEEYIAAKISQLQQMKARLARSPFWLRFWLRLALMRQLNTLVEHIDRYKDALVKRTIQGHKVQVQGLSTISLWHRLLTHPKNRSTLSFLILPDRVLVIQAARFKLDFRVIPVTRLAVRDLVQQWHRRIQGMSGGRKLSVVSQEVYEASMVAVASSSIANTLSDLLEIPALLKHLSKDVRALTIVPDDILHGFPFAAIVYQGRYLVEQYALSVTYESKKRRTRSKKLQHQALVVGISSGGSRFMPLPGVKNELNQVNHWLTQRRINSITLENQAAHKAVVLEAFPQSTLLHMACHGTFEPNQPDRSGLVLISDSSQQEILSLRELSELNLRGLQHATLSSCWSADHFILPGRWIISLPETLWRSGAQSILGCLWEVYDQMAVSFMTRFYEYLDELTRDEALRHTQLDCLQNRLPNCSHLDTTNPLFWSGFTLYGDFKALPLAYKSSAAKRHRFISVD
jgi:tetratricopeptide (TPR) repeat protein